MKKQINKLTIVIMVFLCAACKEPIIHNLTETEANRLVTRLHEIEITSEKVKQPDGKWTIKVESDETLKAIKYLNDSRMLREENPALASKSSMLATREDQRFRFERALSREIETTLASIDGVLEARVHLNLPPTDPLFGQPLREDAKGSASVLLIAQSEVTLDKAALQALVAGASGIETRNIAVLISKSNNSAQTVHETVASSAPQASQPAQEMVAKNGATPDKVIPSAQPEIAQSKSFMGFQQNVALQIAISLVTFRAF